MKEFYRVIKPSGRVIIFEPAISFSGFFNYGILHHEQLTYFKKIYCSPNVNSDQCKQDNYVTQGNITRIFCSKQYRSLFKECDFLKIKKYLLYPAKLLQTIFAIGKILVVYTISFCYMTFSNFRKENLI